MSCHGLATILMPLFLFSNSVWSARPKSLSTPTPTNEPGPPKLPCDRWLTVPRRRSPRTRSNRSTRTPAAAPSATSSSSAPPPLPPPPHSFDPDDEDAARKSVGPPPSLLQQQQRRKSLAGTAVPQPKTTPTTGQRRSLGSFSGAKGYPAAAAAATTTTTRGWRIAAAPTGAAKKQLPPQHHQYYHDSQAARESAERLITASLETLRAADDADAADAADTGGGGGATSPGTAGSPAAGVLGIRDSARGAGFLAPRAPLATVLRRLAFALLTRGADNGDPRFPATGFAPPEIRQREFLRDAETLWGAVAAGELARVKAIVERRGSAALDERGADGETLLHLAVVRDRDLVAEWIAERRPDLVNAVYESHNYMGQSVCHILAVKNKLAMLRRFVELGADVHTPRATGKFFRQSGTLYLGGTVLAFAACMGHLDFVKYLIEEAHFDPISKDHYGNNVLHVLAWWGYFNDPTRSPHLSLVDPSNPATATAAAAAAAGAHHPHNNLHHLHRTAHPQHATIGGLYLYLKRHADDSVANYDGMTPLQVAVSRGNTEMVHAILTEQRQVLWVYGKGSSYVYDLSEVDTYVDPYVMNHTRGALEIAINKKHMSIVSLPLFQRLLEAKWASYARRMFYFEFLASLSYMCLFTVMIALLPNGGEFYTSVPDPAFPPPNRFGYTSFGPRGIARLVIELMVLASNATTLADELQDVIVNPRQYFAGSGRGENIIQFASAYDTEVAALGLHAVTGWLYLMYFSKGFKQIGTLFLVFTRILQGDLLRFVVLISVFILGFGEALFLQMAPFAEYYAYYSASANETVAAEFPANPGYTDWGSLSTAFLWPLRILLQQGSFDDYRRAHNSWLAMILFLVLAFTLIILMLNVFIAMLNATFSSIMTETEKQWRMVWAELIMKFDETILIKHTKDPYARRINGPTPVCRIGFPTRTQVYDARKLRDYRNRKLQREERRWWRVCGAVAPSWWRRRNGEEEFEGEEDAVGFYRYNAILEFRDDMDLPIRMVASTNALSPLYGRSNLRDNPWSTTPLSQLSLFEFERGTATGGVGTVGPGGGVDAAGSGGAAAGVPIGAGGRGRKATMSPWSPVMPRSPTSPKPPRSPRSPRFK
ncbi:hypothetical protein DFJ73DRAFT_962772 [Zopfochytrium polystomum]|nr:hypothetical protein DFJ73DRAFT_962772 [Zopfochytrium polystomum]